MRSIPAAKFRQQCLTLLDDLGPEGLVITRNGRAVARLVPIRGPHADLIGVLRGRLRIRGDVRSTRIGEGPRR
ncbi:MAG: type II toxin-antitoxin system Phd/YefM family antitoxin [Planctomycetes bacterium]|nr:type II toxin-antitoxin system Phd/YefM family antitoxin [Planctomycetota bacterium]